MTIDEIREALRAAGLGRLADEAERLTLPAIRITAEMADEADTPVGASKIGGRPDLPQGFVWPEWRGSPLTFLAQFHLPDLVNYDVGHVLPTSGVLSFFYEVKAQPWGMEPTDRGAWKVAYYAGELSALRRTAPPNPSNPTETPAPHRLGYSVALTIPNLELIETLAAVSLSREETDRYMELEDRMDAPNHWLLGHPDQVQGLMQLWCELGLAGRGFAEVQRADGHLTPEGKTLETKAMHDWRLLLQLDSLSTATLTVQGYPREVEWGLGGRLYFWIRKEDLARRNFSDVWLQLQTS